MANIEIKGSTFIRGESLSNDLDNAGFSPESYGLNLTKARGMLYFAESPTELGGATLTGNLIAGADDRNYLGNDKYFLDDAGAFYTLSGATFTKRQDSASTFVLGTSDLVQFNLTTYATSTDSLHELTGGDLASCERLWGASLDSSFRHPLEVVEDEMFVANKNVIYYLNNAGTTGTAFTLPTQVNVTSLRKHTDGRTLLAFCGTTGDSNGAHTRAGKGKIYFCDPILRDWIKEVDLESQVEGTRNVGGIIYCTWGKAVGYFTGDGVKRLKPLETSTTTYSHSMSNMEDILLIRDGQYVLAFGDLGAGNVWWKNHRDSATINMLAYQGSNKLLVGTAGADLNQINYDNAGVNGVFRTNRMFFGNEVVIRRFDLIHDTTTANSTRAFFSERLYGGTTNTIFDRTWPTATRTTRFPADVKTDMFQLDITPSSGAIGYNYIRIQYEPIK